MDTGEKGRLKGIRRGRASGQGTGNKLRFLLGGSVFLGGGIRRGRGLRDAGRHLAEVAAIWVDGAHGAGEHCSETFEIPSPSYISRAHQSQQITVSSDNGPLARTRGSYRLCRWRGRSPAKSKTMLRTTDCQPPLGGTHGPAALLLGQSPFEGRDPFKEEFQFLEITNS